MILEFTRGAPVGNHKEALLMGKRHRIAWFGAWLVLAAVLICSCTRAVRSPQNSSITEAGEMEGFSHIHHGIDYIEFTVTDMAEAKRFYEAAFGWKFTDYGPEYAGIRIQDRETGGLSLDTKMSVGGPLVILYSNDLDMTVKKVREAGGRIVKEPFEFPGVTNLRSGPRSNRSVSQHSL